jgi:glutathionyl-hydroquinone reductase
VPELRDKQTKTIVNNESIDLNLVHNSDLNSVAKNVDPDLIPEDIEAHLEELNSWIHNGWTMDHNVHQCDEAGGVSTNV